jgi:SAM-dependent methyltransferase
MTATSDLYQITARYYDDAYSKKQDLNDLPFYLELANKTGGPVLELACGTGRVLLSIAREGIAVHGVDNSASMLKELENSLKRENKDVRELVSVVAGDMRTFRSNRKYPLVMIPFRPMQHMYTVEDQLSALSTAAFHLDDGGILAFDVFYPRHDLLLAGIGQEKLEMEWPVGTDGRKTMSRYFRKEALDKIQQTFDATFIYRTYQDGKVVAEETAPLKMCWYTYPHLKALFMLAGLEIVEEYGSFAKTPLDNTAEQMIFLLRRAG